MKNSPHCTNSELAGANHRHTEGVSLAALAVNKTRISSSSPMFDEAPGVVPSSKAVEQRRGPQAYLRWAAGDTP